MSQTVLITGIAGFCGSYLAEWLAAQGCRVVGLDVAADAAARLRALGVEAECHALDLADETSLRRLLAAVQPQQIYHLAALTNPSAPYQTLYEVNVYGTIRLLQAVAAAAADATVLVAGSSAEYGPTRPDENPIDETQALRPITHYAVSKATQGLLAGMMAASGLKVVRTRSFNIIGPRQGPQFVTSAFARQIAAVERGRAEPMIEVGNLAAVRDFIDVRDVVRAYALAASAGRAGEIYNVCSGVGHSIQSLLDDLLALSTVRPIEVRPVAARMQAADVPAQVGSAARLAHDTGWQPLVPWQQSLASLLDYWRSQASLPD